MDTAYLNSLSGMRNFNRTDLMGAMNDSGVNVSDSMFKVVLKKLLDTGAVIRIGRNAYCVGDGALRTYEHRYSGLAETIAALLRREFPYLDFTVFELIQLNSFLNHQIAHNAVFLSVESDLGDFVFDALRHRYPGKVLLNPSLTVYHQYWSDDMIVIRKLTSEAPAGKKERWHTCIEKMLVDIFCEPILKETFSSSELPVIYEDAFSKYVVDESCLFRYAARRGAAKKLKDFLTKDTNVKLRTV